MEDEEESLTDANNVTTAAFSCAPSSRRGNVGAIFTSERLDKSDKLVNPINNLKIKDKVYELNKTTTSDAQGNLMGYPDTATYTNNRPDTVTHTSNRILD